MVAGGEVNPPTPPADATLVCEGFWTHRNPKNRFCVAHLSYTADPAKRTPEWEAEARAGMPDRAWAREYGLSFESPAGTAVFLEFSPAHLKPVPILPEGRILRGWDFGAVAPAVVFAQVDLHGRLLVQGELVLEHVSLGQLADAVLARTLELYGRRGPCFDAGDPAGEAMTDLGAIRRELQPHGILLETCRAPESYDQLRARLLRQVYVPKEGLTPALLIHPRCAVLVEAMQGAFHYSDRPTQRDPRPVPTHPYKDVADALRYLHDALAGRRADHTTRAREIARADWAWT